MGTKITKVRIGSTVYEKTVEVPDPPAVKKPSPAPEPTPSPEPTLLEKAVEAVEEVVKPKRRGRPKKKPDAE